MTAEKGGRLQGWRREDKAKWNRDVNVRDLEAESGCGECHYECEMREI